jgi:hypothetical protein
LKVTGPNATATIRYAPKPWDRKEGPLKRSVNVPRGLTEPQVALWLEDMLMMKSGEVLLSVEGLA